MALQHTSVISALRTKLYEVQTSIYNVVDALPVELGTSGAILAACGLVATVLGALTVGWVLCAAGGVIAARFAVTWQHRTAAVAGSFGTFTVFLSAIWA